MQFPTQVTLDASDTARVRDLNEKTVGVQRMLVQFQESGERRFQQLQAETVALFQELAEKYRLDLEHVTYVPSRDGKFLIPVQVKLADIPNG